MLRNNKTTTVLGIKVHLFATDRRYENQEKNCTTFEQTKPMKDKMNQDIYVKVQENLLNSPDPEHDSNCQDECLENKGIDITVLYYTSSLRYWIGFDTLFSQKYPDIVKFVNNFLSLRIRNQIRKRPYTFVRAV